MYSQVNVYLNNPFVSNKSIGLQIYRSLFIFSGVCARGFYGTIDRVCHECEIGTYQEDPGMLNCTQCQPPLSTLNDESRSVDDCICK